MQKATADAERLFRAGEGKLGTDESTFNMILATRSFPQLKATIHEYGRVNAVLYNSGDKPPSVSIGKEKEQLELTRARRFNRAFDRPVNADVSAP
ncbi:hypothetical protein scyTo_0026859 [Scyliorhinus torazame]|uniref:Uncharacterized protein n=1 Tax=Scyliorhinus torazame TaxID=75743 RepID=A0A401QLD8_SCYTO|nr:hypothetical protein [Scyliorhinus torazame]